MRLPSLQAMRWADLALATTSLSRKKAYILRKEEMSLLTLASCSIPVWALGIGDGVLRSIWDMRAAEVIITSFHVKNGEQRNTMFLI